MRVKRETPVQQEQALVPIPQAAPPVNQAMLSIGAYPHLSPELQEDVFVAGLLAKSGFFPNTGGEAQAFAKMQLGRELGIGRATAMRELYVVQGRLAMSATLIGALIRRSGVYDYKVPHLNTDAAVVDIYKNGEFIGRSEFTKQDAEAAEMLGKDTYKKYLRNMLLSRAMSNAARWYTPEIFVGGAYTPDELGVNVEPANAEDVIDAESYSTE